MLYVIVITEWKQKRLPETLVKDKNLDQSEMEFDSSNYVSV